MLETERFGCKLAKNLKRGDIVALHGDLGAGKTTLVKGIVNTLTTVSKRDVQSPTFTYLNIYDNDPTIYHFDLYRLKDSDAFVQLGFLDYLGEEGICLIEWAERITSFLPAHTIHIELKHTDTGDRKIHVCQP